MGLGVFSEILGNRSVLSKLSIKAPADALRFLEGDPLSVGRRGFVCRLPCSEAGSGWVYLKVNLYPRRSESLRRALAGDPATREFKNLTRLLEERIPCPKVLARGRLSTWSRGLLMSFLVVEEVPHSIDLESLLLQETKLSEAARMEALKTLGRQVGELHKTGFVHRDLHFRNVLAVSQADTSMSFIFIDSPKGQWTALRRLRRKGHIHDLSCLFKHAPQDLTVRERAAFLRAYRLGGPPTADSRAFVKDASQRARVLMERRESKLKERSAERPSLSREKIDATHQFCKAIADRYGSI